MFKFLAHSGDTHASSAESTAHLLSSWYIALPAYIFAVFVFATVVYFVSHRSKVTTFFVTTGALLISGVYLYEKSPTVSAVAITIGLFGSLFSTLAVLSNPKN